MKPPMKVLELEWFKKFILTSNIWLFDVKLHLLQDRHSVMQNDRSVTRVVNYFSQLYQTKIKPVFQVEEKEKETEKEKEQIEVVGFRSQLIQMASQLHRNILEELRGEIEILEQTQTENWNDLKNIDSFPQTKQENQNIRQDMVLYSLVSLCFFFLFERNALTDGTAFK